MNAQTLIDELQKLPPDELRKVGAFLNAYLSDLEADQISAQRASKLADGLVKPLSHTDVFGHALSVENDADLPSLYFRQSANLKILTLSAVVAD